MFGKFIQRTSLAISIYVYIHMTRIDIIEFLIILRHCFTLLGIRAERSVEFVLGIGFRVVFYIKNSIHIFGTYHPETWEI